MIIGTAGHVDHGKTALVKALTGIDADRLAEEKRRGITIDLGYAYTDAFGFVDVPGHERFVHTMLAGASGVDAALLVVALDDGVMPQTREHVQILQLLGIDRGVVALTKADLAPGRVTEVGCAGARAAGADRARVGAAAAGVRGDRRGDRGIAAGAARARAATTRRRPVSAPRGRSRLHADRRRSGGHRHAGRGTHPRRGPADAVAARHRTARARTACAEPAGATKRSPASASR